MKIPSYIVQLTTLCACLTSVVAQDTRELQNSVIKLTKPCLLIMQIMDDFFAGVSTQSWKCSIDPVDGFTFASVGNDIDLSKAKPLSGKTTLFAEGMTVVNGKLVAPPGAQIIFGVKTPPPPPSPPPVPPIAKTMSPTTLPPTLPPTTSSPTSEVKEAVVAPSPPPSLATVVTPSPPPIQNRIRRRRRRRPFHVKSNGKGP